MCTETDWEDYFEVQEISSKDTFIFKVRIYFMGIFLSGKSISIMVVLWLTNMFIVYRITFINYIFNILHCTSSTTNY